MALAGVLRRTRRLPVAVAIRPSVQLQQTHLKALFARCTVSAVGTGTRPEGVVANAAEHNSKANQWWHIWKYERVRRLFRGVRIAFLAYALYNVGKADGMQLFAADPESCRRSLARAAIKNHGAIDANGNPKLLSDDSPEVAAVKRVFPRVLKAALEECESQLRRVNQKLEKLEGIIERRELEKKQSALQIARRQLKSWPSEGFLVLDVGSPNAFVTPMVPKVIFVHGGLFKTFRLLPLEDPTVLEKGIGLVVKLEEGVTYHCPRKKWSFRMKKADKIHCKFVRVRRSKDQVVIRVKWGNEYKECCVDPDNLCTPWKYSVCETDEQLAMLLGHELSHVIHQHGSHGLEVKAEGLALQMVLLAVLDPTGIVSLLIEACMGYFVKYGWELPHSRDHEFEADATGLRIVARALYDPHDATSFFERMLEFSDVTRSGATGMAAWRSTHPAHEDRIAALRELEKDAMKYYVHKREQAAKNAQKAEETHAPTWGQRLLVVAYFIATVPLVAAALKTQ